jgi:ribonuclease HI
MTNHGLHGVSIKRQKSHAYVHLQAHSQIQVYGNHPGNTSNAGSQVQQIQNPKDLQGIICYVDASTEPDSISHNIRPAGLGIVIVNTQMQPASKIHIKAILKDTSSVIMAEAAAISLAAKVLNALQVHEAYILSDNIVLLQYLGEQDRIHPPDWRMKTYIQHFDEALQTSSFSISKIDRNNNDEADFLARQALLYNLDLSLRLFKLNVLPRSMVTSALFYKR